MTHKAAVKSKGQKELSRREFLRAAALAASGLWATRCSPKPQQSEQRPKVSGKATPRREVRKALRLWTTQYFNPNITRHLFEQAQRAGQRIGFAVEAEAIPGSFQEYSAKISAAAEAGTLPDILCPQISTLQFIKDGRLLPIPDVWEKVGRDLGGWHPVAVRNFSVEGVGYALDDGLIPAYMHIRQDLVEAAGFTLPFKNLQEMESCAKALTKPGENLFGCGFTLCRADDLAHLQPYLWAFGGAVQDKAGNITLNSAENAQALRRYTDLYLTHKVVPQGAVNWNDGSNNQAYLSGQVAMAINPGSLLASMRRGETPIAGLLEKTFVAPLPEASPQFGPQCQTQAGSAFAINADTPFPEAAKEILLHLWSPSVYLEMMRMGQSYLFPALLGAYNDEHFTKDPWNKRVVDDVLPIVHDESWAGPPRPWTMMYSTWAGQAIQRVISDHWSAEQALEEAQKAVEDARASFAGVVSRK